MALCVAVYDPKDRKILEPSIIEEIPAKIVKFRMHDVGGNYPVVVRSDNEEDFIMCTLTLLDKPKKVLDELHKNKGCYPEKPDYSIWSFEKIGETPIGRKSNQRVYMYMWRRDTDRWKIIPSGEYAT